MPKEYDISQMSLDEVEVVVNNYDPYDPAGPPQLESSKQEPPLEYLSTEEMFAKEPVESSEYISSDEMFPQPELRALRGAVDIAGKTTKLIGKGAWKTLGILSWPFMRIEAGFATPVTSILKTLGPLVREPVKAAIKESLLGPTEFHKTVFKKSVRDGITPYTISVLGKNFEAILDDLTEQVFSGNVSDKEVDEALGEAKAALPEILPAFYHGAKSFVPFTHQDPEKVKNFNDMWATYYETLTGEPEAPEWMKQVSGIATAFLTTPFIFGKFLQLGRAGMLKIPAIKRFANRKLPAWEEAKLTRKANVYERNEKAVKLGKALADKDVKRIAAQLSRQTGKNITPEAVKLRLGQVIKGSVTEQQVLAGAANPVIEELGRNFQELQKLGLLGKETYLTKLTRADIVKLNTGKQKLLSSLERLETAPHYVRKGGEISARFPGRAKQIAKLKSKIDVIDEHLWGSTHIGGELYMPRMYTTKEAEIAARKFPVTGAPKVRVPYAKARKKIPIEARKELGEILEPGYPVTKRLIQESMDIETAKLFKFAAERGDWVDDAWREGLALKALPDTKVYGALKGKFVTQQIYNDVTELNRVRSDFESLYDSIIGSWKIGKVTLSPATHFRNTISNSILLDLSGTDHAAQTKLFVRALKEARAGTKE